MYQLKFTNRFKRAYQKLDGSVTGKVDAAISLLSEGPPYPNSLRVKKMQGHDRVYEASPTMAIRLTYEYEKPDVLVLRNVGPHDITLSKP